MNLEQPIKIVTVKNVKFFYPKLATYFLRFLLYFVFHLLKMSLKFKCLNLLFKFKLYVTQNVKLTINLNNFL